MYYDCAAQNITTELRLNLHPALKADHRASSSRCTSILTLMPDETINKGFVFKNKSTVFINKSFVYKTNHLEYDFPPAGKQLKTTRQNSNVHAATPHAKPSLCHLSPCPSKPKSADRGSSLPYGTTHAAIHSLTDAGEASSGREKD